MVGCQELSGKEGILKCLSFVFKVDQGVVGRAKIRCRSCLNFIYFRKIYFNILKLFKYVFFDALESNYLTNLELVDIMLALKVT